MLVLKKATVLRLLGLLAVGAAILAGYWYLVTPARAVNGLIEVTRAGDEHEIARRIDIDSVRASLDEQMTSSPQPGRDDRWAKLGDQVVSAIRTPLIDAVVTPDTVSLLFLRFDRDRGEGDSRPAFVIEREGINSFVVREGGASEGRGLAFRFRRDGGSWVLSEQLLPGSAEPR